MYPQYHFPRLIHRHDDLFRLLRADRFRPSQYLARHVCRGGLAVVFANRRALGRLAILMRIARRILDERGIALYRQPALALLIILALGFVVVEAPDTLPFAAALRDLLTVFLIVVLTWLAVRSVGPVAEALVQAHPLDSQTICKRAGFTRRHACWRVR